MAQTKSNAGREASIVKQSWFRDLDEALNLAKLLVQRTEDIVSRDVARKENAAERSRFMRMFNESLRETRFRRRDSNIMYEARDRGVATPLLPAAGGSTGGSCFCIFNLG
ncbi:hypothetical protein K0M31_007761 [Melipona bicolor]|uniref:Uncharacterized protein n=1 Tax=Melipona bicolor TaxID=60889 RepID=A0AA40GCA8_9HYME|nr:hypothetical protein K0M31_007761 [Melipona bicolor]